MEPRLRVVVADSSPAEAASAAWALRTDPEFEVVALSRTATEAVEQVRRLRPNLVVMELSLSGQGTFEAVEHIMAEVPTPILILTNLPPRDPSVARRLIASGALEVMAKPASPAEWEARTPELLRRAKILAQVRVITHLAGRHRRRVDLTSRATAAEAGVRSVRVVAIAASTGGPRALMQILNALPSDFGAALLVAQHIAQGFASGLRDWLADKCTLNIQVAADGMPVRAGVVILARDDQHMVLDGPDTVRLYPPASQEDLCPSGDRLLESAARAYGRAAVGVILSGMGRDGAKGLQAIYQAGGWTIAQDERTSVVFGMPQAAIEAGAAAEVLSLSAIAARLVELSLPGV